MTAVYLNALGVLCALGSDAKSIRRALFAYEPSGVAKTDRYTPGRPLHLGCVHSPLPDLAHVPTRQRSRGNALLEATLQEVRPAVQAVMARCGPSRVAVILGVSTAGVEEGARAARWRHDRGSWPPTYNYAQQEMGTAAEFVAQALGARGPRYAISTACSSGAKALASGARLLRAGIVDAVVAGGADALCGLTIAGFGALESVSVARCNPMSVNRCGINLGEGAALFLMSREAGPVRLAGWGESSDAHHMSAPDPTGRGAASAMRQALRSAEMAPDAIDYVNLHGTATPHNDAMECLAISEVLGTNVPISSTKPLTGHALAAAGAIEAALAWHTLTDNATGRLPPHWWDGAADPALAPMRLVSPGESLGHPVRRIVSNSFAFGGSNASLVFARE